MCLAFSESRSWMLTRILRAVDHSISRSIDLNYGDSWISGLGDIFVAAEQSGMPKNPDVNTGNAIGMGIGSMAIYNGQLVSAVNSYPGHPPSNVTILPNAAAAKIPFKDKKAVGIKAIDGYTPCQERTHNLWGALNTL